MAVAELLRLSDNKSTAVRTDSSELRQHGRKRLMRPTRARAEVLVRKQFSVSWSDAPLLGGNLKLNLARASLVIG